MFWRIALKLSTGRPALPASCHLQREWRCETRRKWQLAGRVAWDVSPIDAKESAIKYVALFRNMNLGHRGSPRRPDLEQAFADAGAFSAASFQTNGTVVFETAPGRAEAVMDRATALLGDRVGYTDVGILSTLDDLARAAKSPLFERHQREDTYRECLTWVRAKPGTSLSIEREYPWTNTLGDTDFLGVEAGIVVTLIRQRGNQVGAPTKILETAYPIHATTRTRGTVLRLLKAHTAHET